MVVESTDYVAFVALTGGLWLPTEAPKLPTGFDMVWVGAWMPGSSCCRNGRHLVGAEQSGRLRQPAAIGCWQMISDSVSDWQYDHADPSANGA